MSSFQREKISPWRTGLWTELYKHTSKFSWTRTSSAKYFQYLSTPESIGIEQGFQNIQYHLTRTYDEGYCKATTDGYDNWDCGYRDGSFYR